jgi:dTDP-glucose pyrophosphorylase
MINRPDIKARTVGRDELILDALKKMDENAIKLLLVVEGVEFIGLLSIGDIQRGIINGVGLDRPIKEIMRSEFRVAQKGDSYASIKQLMLKYRAECMPVVDGKVLVELYFWEDVFEEEHSTSADPLETPVVIMAGGRGARLKPITNIIPKPLIPVGEKPIMEVLIHNFRKLGVKKFYASVNYKAEMIEQYFNNIERDYSLEYLIEDRPLGTAGSMYLLKDKIDSTFFVSNCDILINQDYRETYEFHKQHGYNITMVAAVKQYPIPYGTVEAGKNGEMLSMKEKPEITFMINTGMYILEPEVLQQIPDNQFLHITDLIQKVKASGGKIGVYPVPEHAWLDMGQWHEYHQTLKEFERRFGS